MIPSYTGHVGEQPTPTPRQAYTASTLGLRAVMLICPVLVIVFTSAASGELNVLVVLLALGFAHACALSPDSHLPLALVVALGVHWAVVVDADASAWSLAAAVPLCTFHSATALATTLPSGARIPAAMVRRWTARTSLVVVSALAVWIAIVVAHRYPLRGSSVLVAVTLAAIAMVTLAAKPVRKGRREAVVDHAADTGIDHEGGVGRHRPVG